MKVIIVCGGTAGHINPALAVAERLREKNPDMTILFVGAGKKLENKLIPQAGYKLVNIEMSGLRRGIKPMDIIKNAVAVKLLIKAKADASKLINEFKPDAIFGTGSYICYPIIKRASKLNIPCFLHESNAIPGLTTKRLSLCVDHLLISYPGQEYLYSRPDRVIFTGTPVRTEFLAQTTSEGGNENNKPLVVSFWGSLGAEKLNEIMPEFIKLNIDSGLFRHIHAVGKSEDAKILNNLISQFEPASEKKHEIQIREYIDDMPSVMNAATVVVCRAGASTLAELKLLGKPAILVPSPYVTNDHQRHNAMQLKKAGGVEIIDERDCTAETLYSTVAQILSNKEKLKRMSEAQKMLAVPDAADKISQMIVDTILTSR